MRIVSLVPAATEIVFAIGAGGQLVGRSHECDHPPQATGLPVLTRPRLDTTAEAADIDATVRRHAEEGEPLYDVDRDLLADLRPDLVITQGACEVCALPEAAARDAAAEVVPGAEVLSLSPATLADVAGDIERVGKACHAEASAARLRHELATRFRRASIPVPSPPRVALLEWLDPPMLAGHWAPEVVAAAGCIAAGPTPGSASTTASWTDVEALRVDALVVSPCGFDLQRTGREAAAHREHLLRAAPRVLLVDGNAYFNRPGPRLVLATEGLAAWLTGRRPLPEGFAPIEDWS